MMQFDLGDKKTMTFVTVVALEAVLLLAAMLYIFSLRNENVLLSADKTALEAERKELYARLQANFPQEDEYFSVSGKVKDIRGSVLFIETEASPDLPPLPREQWPTVVLEVGTTKDTVFVILDYDYDDEGVPTPRETETTAEDMQIGDNVTVESSENIKDKESFVASKVIKETFMDPNEGEGD